MAKQLNSLEIGNRKYISEEMIQYKHLTTQYKSEAAGLYVQAAKNIHLGVLPLVEAGKTYKTDEGKEIKVSEGYVGVIIPWYRPEEMTKYWEEYERLKSEQKPEQPQDTSIL